MQKSFGKFILIFLFIFLASCGTAVEDSPKITSPSIQTITLTPIISSPTPTSIPLTPTATGPKEGDTYTVTEDEHEYTYTYTKLDVAEDGEVVAGYVREVANFPMIDYPGVNFIPFEILVADSVSAERAILEFIHTDDTVFLPDGTIYDPLPITATFAHQLRGWYFATDSRNVPTNEQQLRFIQEMDGSATDGHKATLPIILSNGEEANVAINKQTGVILIIMSPEMLNELGGDRLSVRYVDGIAYYAEVYGIDEKGNMLCRLAFDMPLSNVPDEAFRKAIFVFPAALAERKDMREIGQSDLSITLALKSTWTQPDGVTKDLEIGRVSTAQP